MLHGKDRMPPFALVYDAIDLAAVTTFIRNNLGNSVGDSIQPKKVRALQAVIME